MVDVIEDLDLRQLAEQLRARAPVGSPVGYLRGKGYFRDLTSSILGCSQLQAEDIVDTLEMRGHLRFQGDPSDRAGAMTPWEIIPETF